MPHAERLIRLARSQGRRFPEGTRIMLSSATISDELGAAVRETLADSVMVMYGTNEVGTITSIDLSLHDRPKGSVGFVVAETKLEIVDDNHRCVPANVAGHIRMQAPGQFTEYYKNPEETARVLRDGWFYPGDVGRLDENGHLILLGRSEGCVEPYRAYRRL